MADTPARRRTTKKTASPKPAAQPQTERTAARTPPASKSAARKAATRKPAATKAAARPANAKRAAAKAATEQPRTAAASMLEAHVAFETAQWTGPAARTSLSAEIEAGVDWLAGIPLRDLVSADDLAAWLLAPLHRGGTSGRVAALVHRAAQVVHSVAAGDSTPITGMVERSDADQVLDAVTQMPDVHGAVVARVTTSKVYARLLSHVLYTGLKEYALTENVVARRVPGAGSLLRLGHHAISSAAPGLERGIDRQLRAFVDAQVAESIKDSRAYLTEALDDSVLREAAAAEWRAASDTSVAHAVSLVPAEIVGALSGALLSAGAQVLRAPLGQAALRAVIEDWYDTHADRTLADLLDGVEVPPAEAVAVLTDAALPVVDAAVDSGYLAARIRARLTPFYASYELLGS